MEDLCLRTVLLAFIALGLFGCAGGGFSTTMPWSGTQDLELSRLPAESKVYFRHPVGIPARTGRVWLPSEPGVSTVRTELLLDATEVDRVITPSTPLLVDRIATTGTPGFRGPCGVTLSLRTSGGTSIRFRIVRSETAGTCSRPTVGDIAYMTIVVPSPPIPIQ